MVVDNDGFSAGTLGGRIRDRRKAYGYTQQELADAIGVSRKFVVELESGKETASLGLTLRALKVLGFDAPGSASVGTPGEKFAKEFEETLAAEDYEFALRLIGEYASASLRTRRALMFTAPCIKDQEYLTALGAITQWVSNKTGIPAPSWTRNIRPSAVPVFLSEKLYPVGDLMKELIRKDTPLEMKNLNVWIRERDLVTA